ncbi:MAG: glycosyltransferase [Spirochaetales bacterium]|nr:glycosyltransferase [Spirochaetales bacterium]
MKVSIVIPTLNEERLLPLLLDTIRQQDFQDYEIIVADAGSADSTRAIAREAGAVVVDGGLPGPGRNAGARAASGEYIFFLDADVQLPAGFLRNAVAELDERYLDLATCEIRPLSNFIIDRLVHRFINLSIRASLRVDPKAMGFCIFITRRLFSRAGGFDETVRLGEDAEFVKRAAKISPLHWLSSVHIDVSVRRFEKEGRLAHIKKGIRLNLHRAFIGEVRDDTIEYEFADYDDPPDEYRRKLVSRIENALLKLEKPAAIHEESVHAQTREELSKVAEDLKHLFKRHHGESETGKDGVDER